MARLKDKYIKEVIPELTKLRGYVNPMQVPRMVKIVINMGINSAVEKDVLKSLLGDLAKITGQAPVVRKARKSIANFKLRQGMPVGAMVTLRGARMYEFFDRLINTVLPRLRDFRGVLPTAFDGRGNYSLGLGEQAIFPEINVDEVKKVQGMDISIVTTAKTDEEARELLRLMGMPFTAAGNRSA
ncbi:MAG: 50S ribosomal protein L5 [Verrucomicrobia bacterium]|nr:50S ribosomal protein L5 [Verrucomicrobiota bacterium]MCG2679003.1 50S ribosomal protein L5 [Kiritimatiellia bacterium]MBU4248355.1 50S ribosomal protein L5 [Verrucomicrobiota bacterium]MBU4289740.1 50S ribosomal protein L5 [Verrucomicrobiota bacterium]MBU4428546.1 50S ribosomal protein L5 [Verrucomicrobiota bacterium]